MYNKTENITESLYKSTVVYAQFCSLPFQQDMEREEKE